jgi:hypothetical protein
MKLSELIAIPGKYVLLPFVGGLIGAAIKDWQENRRFFKLKSARNIFGRWTGELSYTKPRHPNEAIEVEFYSAQFPRFLYSRLIEGVIRWYDDPTEDQLIRGGFYGDDQLMFDYKSSQLTRRQFGSLILNLDSSGETLSGNFIGYFDGPLSGTLTLKKRLNCCRAEHAL